MKRLGRRLLIGLTVLSVLLCLVTAALAVSGFRRDVYIERTVNDVSRWFSVNSRGIKIGWKYRTSAAFPHPHDGGRYLNHNRSELPWPPGGHWGPIAYTHWYEPYEANGHAHPVLVSWQCAVPFWLVFTLLVPLPALAVMRRFSRRTSPDLCPVCGYDLRATPARCPECGTITSNPQPATP